MECDKEGLTPRRKTSKLRKNQSLLRCRNHENPLLGVLALADCDRSVTQGPDTSWPLAHLPGPTLSVLVFSGTWLGSYLYLFTITYLNIKYLKCHYILPLYLCSHYGTEDI